MPLANVNLSKPTRALVAINSSSLGTVSGRYSGPKPHKLTKGPTVTSKAPWVRTPKRIASLTTRAKPVDTLVGSSDVD